VSESGQASAVLATARGMNACGINRGSAGNVSVRHECRPDAFFITPTGLDYDACTSDDMVLLSTSGDSHSLGGAPNSLAPFNLRLPSSEWRFHRDIYLARPEAGAIVHTHSSFATALACQCVAVPAFHYMVARFGGDDVRCAAYATFGTQALSDAMLLALRERTACLMAHHGMVVFGRDLEQALAHAVELETLCEQYWRTLQLGDAKLLPAEEMRHVLEKFAGYGQQQR
jgi:L-fuculose-phosphate aldolase